MKTIMRTIKNSAMKVVQIIKLPQCITVLILFILSALSIIASKITCDINPFLSSVLSNVFAGLVTGIAICLISGIKNTFNYYTECKIAFLKELHSECLKFINMYRELTSKANRQTNSDDNLFDEIYDVLCQGNNVDAMISQSQFDKAKAFNPYKFFKQDMNYDAIEHMKANETLREKVLLIDGAAISGKELVELFFDMEKNIFKLNSQILVKIKEYEIRQTLSQKTIF